MTRLSGALARYHGNSFESWIENQHALAMMLGCLSWVRHVSPRVRWVGHGKAAHAVVVGEACADFVGQLVGGRALVVEAKSRSGDSLPLSDIETQQQDHLDRAEQGGGLSLLLLHLAGKRYAVPWGNAPWTIRRTAKALRAVDLKRWAVDPMLYLRPFVIPLEEGL